MTAFLKFFFYLPQVKRQSMEILIQLCQTHSLTLKRLQDKQFKNFYVLNKINFVIQSRHALSWNEFECLSHLLFSNLIGVALVYKNHIWNHVRLQFLNTISSDSAKIVLPKVLQENFFRKKFILNLQKICF